MLNSECYQLLNKAEFRKKLSSDFVWSCVTSYLNFKKSLLQIKYRVESRNTNMSKIKRKKIINLIDGDENEDNEEEKRRNNNKKKKKNSSRAANPFVLARKKTGDNGAGNQLGRDEEALEQEVNKVMRAQLEHSQVQQEIERKIKDVKDESFLELSQVKQEIERRIKEAKDEYFRHQEKREADLNELVIAVEHANGANSEAEQTIKKYQGQIREAQQILELEQQHRDKAREQLIQSERKAHAVRNELEETKTQLEHADRQRRTAEQQLSYVMEQVADSTLQNQALQSSNRKLDSEMQTMQVGLNISKILCISNILTLLS